MQRIVDAFVTASSKFGMKINTKKDKFPVQECTCLDMIIARDGHIEAEPQKRMSKANMSFGRLRERLSNNHNASIRVKGKIYRAIMLSTLLYGGETWTVNRKNGKKLQAFMMRHMRSIMKIKWKDKGNNIKVLKWTGRPAMEDLLIRHSIRWTRHLLRMSTDRLPMQVVYSQLPGQPTSPLQRHNQETYKENGY